MLAGWAIVLASFAYLGVLFAIAYYGDQRAESGRSIIANPYIYALSLAVYCTTWTFYGSVGRAASSGIGFLPIYLGPTVMMALWWFAMRKIIRISKTYRTSGLIRSPGQETPRRNAVRPRDASGTPVVSTESRPA